MYNFFFKSSQEKFMKIAMFGGTFDPFHLGHLAMAKYILRENFAEKILFVPASLPPHKEGLNISPYEIRRKSVELSVAGQENMEISDIECEREGRSYSIDTLCALQERYPADRIVMLIGGDSLATLHLWHRVHELVARFPILTMPRPDVFPEKALASGFWSDAERKMLLSGYLKDAPLVDAASTEIRKQLRNGADLAGSFLAPAVSDWIRQQKIYT